MNNNNLNLFKNWMDWRSNRFNLSNYNTLELKQLCLDIGLDEREFQIKGHEIRFANRSNLAFLKMNLNKHV